METVKVDWRGELGAGTDFPRLMLFGGLIQQEVGSGSVLDVGCGVRAFREFVPDIEYTGLALAPADLIRARMDHPEGRFANSEEGWIPATTFDAVVFNESLYYLRDIPGTLAKFATIVNPGGILAVSIYRKGWRSPNARALRDARAFLGEKIIHDLPFRSGALIWDLLIARF